MEKNNLKVGDLVYIGDEFYPIMDKEIIDSERKINKEIKVMNWEKGTIPLCVDGSKRVFRVLHITKDNEFVFIENLEKKYYIYNIKYVKKIVELGDKVKYISNNRIDYGIVKHLVRDYADLKVGSEFNEYYTSIGVEFEKTDTARHDLGGRCRDGYGWYCEPKYIEFINDEQEDDEKNKHNTEEIKKLAEEVEKLVEENAKLTKTIERKERIQDLLNDAVIDKAKDIAVEDVENQLKKNIDKFIEEKYGILPKKIEIVKEDSKKELTGIFHKEFENICKIVNADIPLMLVGSAGAGKNYTLEQVAEALDLDFYFSNAVNQEYKLTGFIDANGTYHETEFYKAFTKGGMFFLDEIDASCPECLVILNSAIANKYFDFPTGRVKAHENFRVVCAGNTYGTGADMIYVGRNVLDGATLDRFVVLPFDYDEEVEKQLAYDDNLYRFIKALRDAINEANLRYIVSMRALINATKLLRIGVDKMSILKTVIIKNMQIDDLNTIVNKVAEKYTSDWTDCLRKMCDNVRN